MSAAAAAGVSEFESACNRFISNAEVSDIIRLTTSLSERLGEIASGDDSVPPSRRGSMNLRAGWPSAAAALSSRFGAGASATGRPRSPAITEENANMNAALANANSHSILTSTLRPKAAAAIAAGFRKALPAASPAASANLHSMLTSTIRSKAGLRQALPAAAPAALAASASANAASANAARNERRLIALKNARADRERYNKALLDPLVAGKTPEDRIQWGTALSALEVALENPGADPNSSEIRGFIDNRNRIRDEYLTPVSGGNGGAVAAAASSSSPNVAGFIKLNDKDKKEAIRIAKLPTGDIEGELLFSKPEIDKAVKELLAKAKTDSTNISTVIERLNQKGGARRRTAHQKYKRPARRLTQRRH